MKGIDGYELAEARAIVERLMAHATRPERAYRHRWSVGDLVFWDNRASMHSPSPAQYGGDERLMHRGYSYVNYPADIIAVSAAHATA